MSTPTTPTSGGTPKIKGQGSHSWEEWTVSVSREKRLVLSLMGEQFILEISHIFYCTCLPMVTFFVKQVCKIYLQENQGTTTYGLMDHS